MLLPADIARELARTRRALGVSQRELARRVGVRQPQIARWEAVDYRTAALERVDAVARALGLGDGASPPGPGGGALLAAEPANAFGAPGAATEVRPVRDLGEIAQRIRALGDKLRDRYGIVRIGVFGSFAAGEQTPRSDVDLLVELDRPAGFAFIEAAREVETVLGRPVDLVRPQSLRERLRDRVLREAVYVWEA